MDKNRIYQLLMDHIRPETKVLIAVSGWVDSMVLFDIIYKYFDIIGYNKNNIYIWHYNHGFREESKNEEVGIIKFFEDKGVNLVVGRYEGKQFDEKNLRDARWGFLNDIIKSNEINYIMTWHHMDDRIETMISNQIRWAWIKWVLNMQPFTSCTIYQQYTKYHYKYKWILRPLIYTSKYNIYQYAGENVIWFWQDHTNVDVSISFRNWIRSQINNTLLKWEDMFENPQETTGFWTEHSINAERYIYKNYHSERQEYFEELQDVYSQDISMISIKSLPSYARYVDIHNIYIVQNTWLVWSTNQIVYMLDQLGLANNISQAYIDELWKFFIFGKSGYKEIGRNIRIYICHGDVYIVEMLDAQTSYKLEYKDDFVWFFGYLPDIAECDLTLPKTWDKFHGKGVNEYLSNQKVPVFLRKYAVLKKDKIWNIISIYINRREYK